MLFFFLYLLTGPGGCVRLEREYDINTQLIVIDGGATRHWSPQPVPERFFGGTKENTSAGDRLNCFTNRGRFKETISEEIVPSE